MCHANNGLILVDGKTGSGKSTTLAAMIDDINTRVKGHILTIEDPIEFVHQRKSCSSSATNVRRPQPEFRRRAALRPARGSRRHPSRRVARPRDDEYRGDRGARWEFSSRVPRTPPGAGLTVDRIMATSSLRISNRTVDDDLAASARRARAAAPAKSSTRAAGRGLGNPGQHQRRLQPHPPGQARPARERHAVGRRLPACAPWTR